LPLEVRQEIVAVIASVKAKGVARYQACALLQIKVRRIERWEERIRRTGSMEYGRSGPTQVVHALMPVEREAVLEYVGREETVDYSYQMLALKGGEEGLFCMSASSVRTILHEESLAEDRTGRMRRGVRVKPGRPEELTGPNQCWCWDISYLRTEMLRVFWYLYVMLDEWSRKVVAWRVSRSLVSEEALALIDYAIIAEKLLDVPEERFPIVVNDRGSQMKAKEVEQMFRDLGLIQTYARPRTPNDNPYVEALFSTVKTTPLYPGWFPSNDGTVVTNYFDRYFTWYNHEHYHSRIGYVTPFQKHTGQAEKIIRQRRNQLTTQRERRKEYWLLRPDHNSLDLRGW
jgi:transposase InsO family protein